MPAALLKMDHPCFYYFFDSSRVYDDFRLLGGLFFLLGFADIFSGPPDDFFVCRRADMRHNSRLGPESNAGKYKTPNRTIDIGVEAITKLTCLRSCKPPEDGLERSLSGGFRLFAVALFSKPEVAASGFPFTRQN
jgi:hypothetical protein